MTNRDRNLGRLAAIAALMMANTSWAADNRELVALSEIAPSIRQDIRYATSNNFTGRPLPGYKTPACLLRRDAAKALARVQAYLATATPPVSLKVFDCYRPMRAVRAMVRWTRATTPPHTGAFYFPNHKRENLIDRGYISSRSSHAKGVAVDLTLVRLTPEHDTTARGGQNQQRSAAQTCATAGGSPDDPAEFDMGTTFDCFDIRSGTKARGLSDRQWENRDTLERAMSRFGFRNYRREWWHFTFAKARGAVASDQAIDIKPHGGPALSGQ